MLRSILLTLFIGMSFLYSETPQAIEKLEAEKKALELKLEAYALKKKIIEMEKFIEKEKLERKSRIEREKALIKLKNDLRANRERAKAAYKKYAG